jgi:hypothetical protein
MNLTIRSSVRVVRAKPFDAAHPATIWKFVLPAFVDVTGTPVAPLFVEKVKTALDQA